MIKPSTFLDVSGQSLVLDCRLGDIFSLQMADAKQYQRFSSLILIFSTLSVRDRKKPTQLYEFVSSNNHFKDINIRYRD